MRRLLDTHVAVWAVTGDPRLTAAAAEAIRDRSVEVYVSVASLWEIAVKNGLPTGRRDGFPFPAAQAAEWFERTEFALLPIEAAHAVAVDSLPPLHRDPFDRMLVAQAVSEPMTLVTHDRRLAAYSELVVVV